MVPWFSTMKGWLAERRSTLKEDLLAGLIVAIVALPLAIGFAIASDVPPAMGVWTAIIGGFVAAVFGGSEYQVSGPTGAMVVVILTVVHAHGVGGLILATFLAGIILLLLGILRLGKVIEYIPSPVIVGFTAGIATIIFFGQLNNFLGIAPSYPEGAEFIGKTFISIGHIAQASIPAVLLAVITLVILIILPRISKRIPGGIAAVVITTLLATAFGGFFAVKTVGDIGAITPALPDIAIPGLSWSLIKDLLPAALTIAVLAAIESLLSAIVADSLTDSRHRPNRELVGQGLANCACALFGGMPATGAIARTATSIRNGAKSRVASASHAVFLLLFVLLAAPLAMRIPLATLAGILMFVAYNMVEWERILFITKTPLSDIAVMLTTFLLTILVDLTVAIEVGLVLAALLFMKRMSDLYNLEELEGEDSSTSQQVVRKFRHPDISIYTVSGPLFFGAASRFDQRVATTPGGHKPIKIIRMKHVPVIDATGLTFLQATVHKHKKIGGVVLFSTVQPGVLRSIERAGLIDTFGRQHFFPTTRQALRHALAHAHRRRGEAESVTEEELASYHLSHLDLEESQADPATRDKDPVEEILDSVGVTRIGEISQEAIHKTIEAGGVAFDATVEAGKEAVAMTVDATARVIDASTRPLRRKKKR